MVPLNIGLVNVIDDAEQPDGNELLPIKLLLESNCATVEADKRGKITLE
jgi:hypothetical protein